MNRTNDGGEHRERDKTTVNTAVVEYQEERENESEAEKSREITSISHEENLQ